MTDGALPIALAFANPALLSGAALVAVPIIIHFLARRPTVRIPWGAMRFLREAELENRRRARLEQWLLLFLRCLAFGLLGLAFARPTVAPGVVGRLLGGGEGRARIVLIDDSASLNHARGGAVDFAVLQNGTLRIARWIAAQDDGGSLSIRRFSQPDAVLHSVARLDAGALPAVEEAIRKLQPRPLPGEPARALAAAAEAIRPLEGPVDLFVFSDFQRSDWSAGDAADKPFGPLVELAKARAAANRTVRVFLGSLGGAARENLALLDCTLERPRIVAGVPALLRIDLANFSRDDRRDLLLDILLDDAPQPAVRLAQAPSQKTASIAAEIVVPDAGFHRLTVRIPPHDGLPLDDVWRGALDVRSSIRVLAVHGARSTDRRQDELYLLRHALAPPGPLASGVVIDEAEVGELAGAALEQYDVVILANIPPPDESIARALQRFVRSGGGLMWSMGDLVGPLDAFERAWGPEGAQLLPARLIDTRTPGEAGSAAALRRAESSALGALLPGEGETVSEQVAFRGWVKLAVDPDTASAPATANAAIPRNITVAARFDDADRSPALVLAEVGRGRVLLYASTVDLDWNDWPRAVDGSYVVTMLETVQFLAGATRHPVAFRAGQSLQLDVAADAYEPTALFKPADYPESAAAPARFNPPANDATELLSLQGPRAEQLGFASVELTIRGGSAEERPLAVNLDARESDLSPISNAELSGWLSGVKHDFLDLNATTMTRDQPPRTELWRTLLLVAAGLLILEQTLAWRFGAAQ
ncbi:MAG: BatA domain-containing protein [Phycisphaerae bacterium]|nr:BatA domain-containing protein [Phycisphaerae bacterium]